MSYILDARKRCIALMLYIVLGFATSFSIRHTYSPRLRLIKHTPNHQHFPTSHLRHIPMLLFSNTQLGMEDMQTNQDTQPPTPNWYFLREADFAGKDPF